MILVDQDLEEPWPIEVYGRDGLAYNVTLEPGDMLLYESHSTIHGRPFPMQGRYYATIDVHFAPIDHERENAKDPDVFWQPSLESVVPQRLGLDKVAAKRSAMLEARNRVGGHEQDNHPAFLIDHHLYHLLLQDLDPDGGKPVDEGSNDDNRVIDEENIEIIETNAKNEAMKRPPRGRTDLHVAAARGSYDKCLKLISTRAASIVHMQDENGWQAIHEAARGGFTDIVELLVHHGADASATTLSGQTPLWWARRSLYEEHEVIRYLESLHAAEGEDTNEEPGYLDEWNQQPSR
jgi:hypothetical protein